jgi:transposase
MRKGIMSTWRPPIIGALQAANFGGLIPTESSSLSSEKSYSPSRLICCHDTTEPLAIACRRAVALYLNRRLRSQAIHDLNAVRQQPHRLRRYMASDDPDFETKAADIIGLYLKPPVNAAVFSVDEKSAIQALDRLDPVLLLSPGRAERHGFEYYRHGTLSLYAALNTKTGQVLGQTAPRHTSAEFAAFLEQIVASLPEGQQIHIIADNLSAHRTSRVWQFIDRHRNVRIHFTPTYSSWLNQVEIWFSKIQRDVIARGIFRSVQDLAKKLMTYIRHYNIRAKPFKWTYRSAERRINPVSGLNATPH